MAVESFGFISSNISPSEVYTSLYSHDCSRLFSKLRSTSIEVREELLQASFEGKEMYFPNGHAFARELADILGYSWFDPQRGYRMETVSENVRIVRNRLGLNENKPIVMTSDVKKAFKYSEKVSDYSDWRNAWARERDKARDALCEAQRYIPWEIARYAGEQSVGGTIANQIKNHTRRRVGSHLQWTVMQDVLGEESPFRGLMNLYGEGFWPIGETEKEFVICISRTKR